MRPFLPDGPGGPTHGAEHSRRLPTARRAGPGMSARRTGWRVLCFAPMGEHGGKRRGSPPSWCCRSSRAPARRPAPGAARRRPGPPGLAPTGAPRPSAGCSLPASASVDELRQDISVDGVARWYLLTTPSTHRRRTPPVVVDLHGLSESATLEAITTQFERHGTGRRVHRRVPPGHGHPAGWDIDPATRRIPIATSTSSTPYSTSSRRICASTRRGSTPLGCRTAPCHVAPGLHDGRSVRGLAPVAGVVLSIAVQSGPPRVHRGLPRHRRSRSSPSTEARHRALSHDLWGKTTPGTTPPPIDLHGTGYPANVQAWADKDGCNPLSTDTQVTTHVILRTYQCPPGVAVEFYIVLGGGHAWPGSRFSATTGSTTFEINATDVIWKFFRRHQLAAA